MNIRKIIIKLLLYVMGSKISRNLMEIRLIEKRDKKKIKAYTDDKIRNILLHAWQNVPYYNKVLEKSGVINEGMVDLKNFDKIPLLTKEIIRKEGKNLYSKDNKQRGSYKNTSGGSTGEPVIFLQDKYYDDWNNATKVYFKQIGGQDIGEKELRLWGSERDLLEGKEKLSIRLRNWIYNRKELNTFRISTVDMERFVEVWNKFRPKWVEAYVQSMYEFALYIKRKNIKSHSPKGILVSAGTLHSDVERLIRKIFKCAVYNRYGSREVGGIACSCSKSINLHIAYWHCFVEILDDHGKAVKPGEVGNVHITSLNNFSMPLIRYRIGDVAITSIKKYCKCGRSGVIIDTVMGRENSILRTKKKSLDSTALTTSFYYFDSIKKYQVSQISQNLFNIKIVLKNHDLWNKEKVLLLEKLRKILGQNVELKLRIVKKIFGAGVNERRYIDSYLRNDVVDSEYITHLFYFKDWIKKFQVIQHDYDYLEIKIVLAKIRNEKDMRMIEKNIRYVMGNACRISWTFHKDIQPLKSGKYVYTLSDV